MRRLLPLLVLAVITAGCVGEAPAGLTCEATPDANELDWEPVTNATSYRIYRFEDANLTDFVEVDETHYTDTNVTKGTSYLYAITGVTPEGESPPAVCEVTAVPFFPTPLVMVLALVGSVGIYAYWRRR